MNKRKIELNWTPPSDGIQPGDWVGLFRRNPNLRGITRVIKRVNANDQGYYKTNIIFPENSLMGMKSSPRATCLYGYWIAYIRDERLAIKNVSK